MTGDLLLAIDQGTTSTRVIAYDQAFRPVAQASRPLGIGHPQPGWVEQDPEEILSSVVEGVAEVVATVGGAGRIAAVGLDNQGETVVAWDAESGRALAPAVVWQCRRSEAVIARLREAGHEGEIRRRTGLRLHPYFSAGKMTWLLESAPSVSEAAAAGRLRLGTVDAWLTARLSDEPLTDPSTASRTQLLDLRSASWDDELLRLFGVPPGCLPRIVATTGQHGVLRHARWGELPLTALACDQQAALAGHGRFGAGGAKASYGTGVFVLATAGSAVPEPGTALSATIAWKLGASPPTYAVDGGVFAAGSLLDWLRDALGILDDVGRSDVLAREAGGTAGVRVLPALGGLGAPWWRDARGLIAGLSAAADRRHVVRAALDAIAQRVADVVEAFQEAVPEPLESLRVDGGLTANGYLMERQADLLGLPVEVATVQESTALGIAGLAGMGAGITGPELVAAANPVGRRFEPRSTAADRSRDRRDWVEFVKLTTVFDPPPSKELR